MTIDLKRRKLCQSTGLVLMMLPVASVSNLACAKTNLSARDKLKYQGLPKEDMSCASCLEFVPDQADAKRGGCKVIPDDDEISIQGYCVAWNSM